MGVSIAEVVDLVVLIKRSNLSILLILVVLIIHHVHHLHLLHSLPHFHHHIVVCNTLLRLLGVLRLLLCVAIFATGTFIGLLVCFLDIFRDRLSKLIVSESISILSCNSGS